ncbi:MAG: glycosyltransferase [Pseudobutyrivibrio sp.]|uniref:glycosyltransferase n=1 Tax=Pseudobutyrivibrio sp. TaxID=2014367 RepID=UPI0025E3DB24|nr:glycosyltransferase [Pseudobutyrivibrio sp.]MBE5904669.1 glycosyltransferase [Pseudobutyrivibrio sp.]
MNTKEKTKLLTISLLCCGRPDTTERCLKSLMPIREAIDSEIQVVDTGCSPETRAIIEKYADEVFEFTWCNDFAKARNFQLDQANGKMFLFIDDDEWFLDTKYIIDFFKQPNCTEYNIGGYYQRNYLDFEGIEYSDIEVVRMCSVTPETRFIGKVHEYIEPAYGNAMFMDAQAGHFGYVYVSEEDNIKHSMRNIPLLKEMMEEQPDNLRWPYQLAQEYRACKYHEELIELCKKALEDARINKEEEAIRYRGPFACGIAIALDELDRYDELIEFYYDELKRNEIMDLAVAKLSTYAAKAFYVTIKTKECVEACNRYLEIMDRLENNKGEIFLQGGIFVFDAFDELHKNTTYCYLMACGLMNDDFGPLVHYYRRISWNSPVVRLNRGFIKMLVIKACEYGYKKELRDVLNKFFTRPGFRDVLQHEIDENLEKIDGPMWKNLKSAFKTTDREKEMNLFCDIRLMERRLLEGDFYTFSELLDKLLQYAAMTEEWHGLHIAWMEEKADKNEVKPEVRLGRLFVEFAEKKDGDPTVALKILKDAIGVRKIMDSTIQSFSKLYGTYQMIKEEKEKDPNKFAEMYNLEEAILKQIADLDAAGKSDEAIATYGQLTSIIRSTYGVDTLHF